MLVSIGCVGKLCLDGFSGVELLNSAELGLILLLKLTLKDETFFVSGDSHAFHAGWVSGESTEIHGQSSHATGETKE